MVCNQFQFETESSFTTGTTRAVVAAAVIVRSTFVVVARRVVHAAKYFVDRDNLVSRHAVSTCIGRSPCARDDGDFNVAVVLAIAVRDGYLVAVIFSGRLHDLHVIASRVSHVCWERSEHRRLVVSHHNGLGERRSVAALVGRSPRTENGVRSTT